MRAYGLNGQIEKGRRYADEDVCIQICRLNNGKHRHQRVRRHKRIYNKITRSQSKAILNEEVRKWG